MTSQESTLEQIGANIREALESADIDRFSHLLDPRVRWGAPGDPSPPCQSRDQVLAWYKLGREEGVRARVTEVVPSGDKLLVGMMVTPRAGDGSGESPRWQVLTVAGGLVVDIRGYDDRDEAAAHAGITS